MSATKAKTPAKKKAPTSANKSSLKKAPAKKAAAKKASAAAKKPAAKKTVTKPSAKKAAVKKIATKKAVAKQPKAKKVAPRKTAAKPTAKKLATKKATAAKVGKVKAPKAPKVAKVKAPKAPKVAKVKAPNLKQSKEEANEPKAKKGRKASAPSIPIAGKPTVKGVGTGGVLPIPNVRVTRTDEDEGATIEVPREVKMTPFLKKQRQRLLDLRSALVDSMEAVAEGSLRQAPEGSEANAFGMHQADAGSDAYDRDFALGLLSKEQDSLYEINEALARIERGTYGFCEKSGKPIPQIRLEALPFTRYTVECQANIEKQNMGSRYRRPVRSLFGLDDAADEAPEKDEDEETEEPRKEDSDRADRSDA
jgi:RNA polymerase-binding transcription factor DksA